MRTVGWKASTTSIRSRRPMGSPSRAASAAGQATPRLCSSTIGVSSTIRPRLSITAIARWMAASVQPSFRRAIRRSCAIPTPAAPPPRMATRSADSRRPVSRSEERMPATTTAAVPWMSSLKLGQRAPVAVEEVEGGVLLEVLPLQHRVGEDVAHRGHELVHQRLVLRTAQPRRPPAEIEVVGEQRVVVGADVEAHRAGSARGARPRPRCRWPASPPGCPSRPRRGRRGRGCARCP